MVYVPHFEFQEVLGNFFQSLETVMFHVQTFKKIAKDAVKVHVFWYFRSHLLTIKARLHCSFALSAELI
jgi:hypothetical protein